MNSEQVGHGLPEDDRDGGPEASTSSSPRMHISSEAPQVEESLLPLPVWMRESSKTFHWRWVPLWLRQTGRSIVKWTKGPDPPQIQRINPLFPSIQEAPARFIDRYLPKKSHKAALLGVFYACWIVTFSLLLAYSYSAGQIKGYGKPKPVRCTASFW